MNHAEHKRAVADFLDDVRRKDPKRYRDVCNQYPVMSRRRINVVKQNEQTVGLLGLQATAISGELVDRYDSIYDDGEKE